MSISFDRAADYYDATRGYPPDVQEQIGRALIEAAGVTPRSRILELGVGTGRIALPIIRAGYPYTGIDLSARMMDRLRAGLQEIPGAVERVTLVEGDITALPFPDRNFDAVITVHVFHLVSDRAAAIAESVRVLARPGVALNGYDDEEGLPEEPEAAWRSILEELGWALPSAQQRGEGRHITVQWERLGATVDQVVTAERESSWTPAQFVAEKESRQWSHTWSIPDEIFTAAVRRLRSWAEEYYGAALETPVPYRRRFVIERGRFA